MNECEHACRLSAYHDGELDPATRAALERHLAKCSDCTAELARIRGLSGLLGGLAKGDPSPRALRRFHAAAEQAASGVIWRTASALTAAAAAILVVCGLWLWRGASAGESAGPMPVWEAVMLQRPAEPSISSPDEQLAMWMVQDLSRENGHGQD